MSDEKKENVEQETPPGLIAKIEKELAEIIPQKEKRKEILSFLQRITFYVGPLPAPDTLKKYDRIIENGAERIMKMAENQQTHRIENESKIVDAKIKENKRGQIFGFIIGLIALVAAVLLAFLDHDVVAGIIGGTTVVGLVTVFVVGRTKKEKEKSR